MTSPIYHLAQLTPKISAWHNIVGFRKASTMRPEDVSLLLAGLSDASYRYGRFFFCGDDAQYFVVVDIINEHVRQEAERQNWKNRHGRTRLYRRLAELSIEEDTSNRICTSCKNSDLLKIKCEKCKGTGIIKMNDAAKARYLNISHPSFIGLWRGRYETAAYGYVVDLKTQIIEHMLKKMRGEHSAP